LGAVRLRRAAILALLAALASGAALTYAGYGSDLAAAKQRLASGSELVDTRCGPIEYAMVGEGPAVLLVHGAAGGFDQALSEARELATRGFRVIAPSRFGYLRTPQRSDATPQAQADAHACLLDALKIARAAVIGVSAGAPSSMQLAIRHPDRVMGLVLLAPMAYSPQGGPGRPPAYGRWIFEYALGSDFLFWVVASLAPHRMMGTPPEVLERADAAEKGRFQRLALQPLPLSQRREGLLNDAVVVTHLPRYELERIAVPTLVISARDDRWGSYAGAIYTAQHVMGARFVGLADGGHLWIGRHREVMGEIAAFLTASAR
jgi:2-hydroxy-6-oxonona-2,4-dienedioate hydrolase